MEQVLSVLVLSGVYSYHETCPLDMKCNHLFKLTSMSPEMISEFLFLFLVKTPHSPLFTSSCLSVTMSFSMESHESCIFNWLNWLE